MTNLRGQYVQAKAEDDSIIVSSVNTVWSVWTVIHSQIPDIKYFRDNKGRYLTSRNRPPNTTL